MSHSGRSLFAVVVFIAVIVIALLLAVFAARGKSSGVGGALGALGALGARGAAYGGARRAARGGDGDDDDDDDGGAAASMQIRFPALVSPPRGKSYYDRKGNIASELQNFINIPIRISAISDESTKAIQLTDDLMRIRDWIDRLAHISMKRMSTDERDYLVDQLIPYVNNCIDQITVNIGRQAASNPEYKRLAQMLPRIRAEINQFAADAQANRDTILLLPMDMNGSPADYDKNGDRNASAEALLLPMDRDGSPTGFDGNADASAKTLWIPMDRDGSPTGFNGIEPIEKTILLPIDRDGSPAGFDGNGDRGASAETLLLPMDMDGSSAAFRMPPSGSMFDNTLFKSRVTAYFDAVNRRSTDPNNLKIEINNMAFSMRVIIEQIASKIKRNQVISPSMQDYIRYLIKNYTNSILMIENTMVDSDLLKANQNAKTILKVQLSELKDLLELKRIKPIYFIPLDSYKQIMQ